MAAKSAEGSVTREPAKLADDFATWWSGVPWTWKLVSELESDGSWETY
jgi:hypothetical protein